MVDLRSKNVKWYHFVNLVSKVVVLCYSLAAPTLLPRSPIFTLCTHGRKASGPLRCPTCLTAGQDETRDHAALGGGDLEHMGRLATSRSRTYGHGWRVATPALPRGSLSYGEPLVVRALDCPGRGTRRAASSPIVSRNELLLTTEWCSCRGEIMPPGTGKWMRSGRDNRGRMGSRGTCAGVLQGMRRRRLFPIGVSLEAACSKECGGAGGRAPACSKECVGGGGRRRWGIWGVLQDVWTSWTFVQNLI
jgi:hypothetical protein